MFDVNAYVSRFRMNLLRASPFYGDVAAMLTFKESSSYETAATNGSEVFINPKFYERLTEGQRNFVTMHELMHVLLLHPVRREGRDAQLHNIAADMIVNSFLTSYEVTKLMSSYAIPFEKPENGIFEYVGYTDTLETIYERLRTDQQERNKIQSKPKDLILCPSGMAEEISDRIAAIAREALRINGSSGRGIGASLPVPQEVYTLAAGKVLNWKKLLKRFMDEEPRDEMSYATPERKYIHMDLILPGHGESEEVLQEIWAFVDCSGSIGHKATESFLLQLYSIVKQFKCRMNVVYWDTAVHEIYRDVCTEKQVMECLPHYSGGTDINCLYEWIKSTHTHIDVMLVLTDGYFGMLRQENFIPQLRSRTILVLNTMIPKDDNTDRIGRIARLEG